MTESAGATRSPSTIVLVRHGQTPWSSTGRHTGRTDIDLDDVGREQAEDLVQRLDGASYAAVFTSPLRRALDTCRLAGYGDRAEVLDDLQEWDYGEMEGRTTAEIRVGRPGWSLWEDGCQGGESAAAVGVRADRVLARIRGSVGAGSGEAVLVFAHGHLLRVLTARWLGLAPVQGRLFALAPATVSRLGWEHEATVISAWNT